MPELVEEDGLQLHGQEEGQGKEVTLPHWRRPVLDKPHQLPEITKHCRRLDKSHRFTLWTAGQASQVYIVDGWTSVTGLQCGRLDKSYRFTL